MRVESSCLRLPQIDFKARCTRVMDAYCRAILQMTMWLKRHGWERTAGALAKLLIEPWELAKTGIRYPLGMGETCHLFGLNPTDLSEAQTSHRPVLLIHGSHDNQSAWLSLARSLNDFALYTVNVPSGRISDEDRRIVGAKICEIQHLHPDQKIDIIGHSRGGGIARWAKLSWFPAVIEKAMTLGCGESAENIYAIQGLYDPYNDAEEDGPRSLTLRVGRQGLLTAAKAHQQIAAWLQCSAPTD